MAASAPRIASVLASPSVYWGFQRLLGASAVHRHVVTEHARVRPGERVLDIGCGPGRALDVLPEVDYVGIDSSRAYVEAARRRYGDRASFHCADAAAENGTAGEPPFDLVLVLGVLHHLDDEAAARVVRRAAAALGPGGRMVTLDPALTADQPKVARWLVSRDRGIHPRDPDAYAALARSGFGDVTASVHHGLAHVPYTHVVLDCSRPEPAS